MGDKGGKKDKEKGQKQHAEKQKQKSKNKLDKQPKRKPWMHAKLPAQLPLDEVSLTAPIRMTIPPVNAF